MIGWLSLKIRQLVAMVLIVAMTFYIMRPRMPYVRVFSERMVVPPGIDGAEVMARLRARHLALAHWWVAHPKGRPSEVPPELRPSVLQPVSRETGAPDDLP